jgi:quercetin dioxygenase-like cupin family protein
MPKSWTDPKCRRQPSLRLVACLLIALPIVLHRAVAERIPSAPPPVHVSPATRMVVSTGNTVTGEPIRYPSGAPAQITVVEITLEPGQQTGWHTHPVPLLGYILEGELTVDYGTKGQRTYRKGDGFAEAMNEAHNGRNMSQSPVKILAVFIGIEGVQESSPASPPVPQ